MRRLGLLAAAVVAGCGGRGPAPDRARVVSLVPSVTEIVYAVGAGDRLAGSTNQCDYPEAARQTDKVGDFAQPDVERIAALKPGLVFLALPIHGRVREKLAELGIRTHASQPEDMAAVLAEIEAVATLLGVPERGRALAESLGAELNAVPEGPDSPRVYVELSSAPLVAAGGRTFVSDIVRRAGGRNAFDDAPTEYPVVAPEDVAARNPDVIVVLHPGTSRAEVAQRVGWQSIAAVRSGRVFDDLDDDLLLRPGPRAVAGVLELAKRLREQR